MNNKYRHSGQIILAGLLVITLSACQNVGEVKDTPVKAKSSTLEEIETLLNDASKQTQKMASQPVPASVNQALLNSPSTHLASTEQANEPRFDIDVANAPIREVLMGLVANTSLNMIVHPQIVGQVSLSLKNVTINETMQTLRDVYGYEYSVNGNTYQVLPAIMQTRIYHLNYINVTRNGYSQTKISAGGNSGEDSSSQSGSGIETTSKADVWEEVTLALTSIISGQKGGQVVVSPHSGTIVLRAMPNELRNAEAFLKKTQDGMRRQVILEAKIIEVELSDGFQAGINWAALGSNNGNSVLAGQNGGGTVFNGGVSDISGNTGNLDPGDFSAVANAATSAFGGVFSAALQIDDFTAFIELLKSQGDVQVLSSPRISTINNQKAVIKVGQDEFFVTEISSGDISGTGNTGNQTAPDITLTPFFSGIALDVTPQIDANQGVTLHIHPSVSDVVDQTKNITVNGQQQSLPLALSSVRESDSIVHAESGQLIVIGGLMKNINSDQKSSTPFFGDLPIIGSLFRHTKQRFKKSELVILLRPLVVESVDTWNQAISTSGTRIDSISSYKFKR